jgi:hypothetical protein
LQQYGEAMPLANESLVRLQGTLFDGYKSQVYISRGATARAQGQLQSAIEDYTQAVVISRRIQNNRDITDAAGGLAQTLEQGNQLPEPRSEPVAHVALTNSKRLLKLNSHIYGILFRSPQPADQKPKKKPCTYFFHFCVEPPVTKCG